MYRHHHVVEIMRRMLIAVVVSATLAPLPRGVAQAQNASDPYTIIAPEPGHKPQPRPEPWLPPKYQSPRGTKQHIEGYKTTPMPPPRALAVPPPVYVPETNRLLPNLPTLSREGPGGAEHPQDRAVRCAHQAGLYGEAAGNRAAYINACINNR